ncbi:MAG: triphosphoribosyl-dephospho-CoA synthase [Alphaproteobacteria bacterium]
MNRIAAAFVAACRDELEAPKPGNVHLFAGGHRMTADDFVRSAEAAAGPIAAAGTRVGERILRALEATRAAVGQNTNLGIVLLCAPLAAAAENTMKALRDALDGILDGLDVEDAALAFRAIVLAAPAGLGDASVHDVRAPATATLAAAMAAAAERDRIAYQFSHRFSDIFDRGLPEYQAAARRWAEPRWAALAVYLAFLADIPDTHIARKFGAPSAESLRCEAVAYRRQLQSTDAPNALLGELMAWDAALKARGINPGTSADLTVATLFARRLLLPDASKSG